MLPNVWPPGDTPVIPVYSLFLMSFTVLRKLTVALLAAAATLSASVAQAQAPPPAASSTPQPVQPAQCPNVLVIPGDPIDVSLRPALTVAWDATRRGILVEWETGPAASCAWFQVKHGSANYAGVEGRAWADFVLAPGQGARLRPDTVAGRECLRLFAVSAHGRSEPVEACTDIPADAVPTPRPPGTEPSPEATPWPAPGDVQLAGRTILLDSDGFPLPADQQVWFAGLSWRVPSGFDGAFEVQRAQVASGGDLQWQSLPSGLIPASPAVSGRAQFEEQVTPLTVWCFRVRTLTWASGRAEGPFSTPVCMPTPPRDGGRPETVTPAPLPPDAGNSKAAEPGRSFALVLAAVAIAITGSALCKRRR